MRLQERYKKEIAPKLMEKFGYKNVMQVPKIQKVTVHAGVGKNAKDKAYIDNVKANLTKITGQAPIITKSKKSISGFKVREGALVGVVVTLRGSKMFDFLEKLLGVSFPRIRDFRGIEDKIIDNHGNMTVGFKEHLSFPEIKSDEMENIHGLEICVSTNAKNREEGYELFDLMGFPFKKK